MATIISHYLDTVRISLRLDGTAEQEIIRELATHIEDEVQELKEAGLSDDEAAKTCIGFLGSAKLVARQIYEAHSQGSWRQALLASMPHILFCLFFALNWWRGIGWLFILISLTAIMTIYGWWHGKPTWLFPWLGYFLIPIMAAGIALLYLPTAWSWLAILIYLPLALWLMYRVISRTIKRDWLYTSLMLFPVPIIIGWFVAVNNEGAITPYNLERLNYLSPWIGLSFLALAIAVGTFIRLRKRRLKIAALSATGLTTLSLVAYHAWGKLELPLFAALVISMVGIFLIPAALESRPIFQKQIRQTRAT